MSWITKIKEVKLEIITGDGKRYTPLWKDATKNINFNTEGFDFIGKDGTHVERKNRSGIQFPFYFLFQGDDHLDEAKEFEESTLDKRPWVISHPFYDDIKVQPLSLEISNINYNTTEYRGICWETLDDRFPAASVDITTTIFEQRDTLADLSQESFLDAFNPVNSDIQPSVVGAESVSKNFSIIENSENLKNLTRDATSKALNLLSAPDKYILAAQSLINYPFLVAQTIEFKLNKIKDAVESLISIFDGKNELLDANCTTLISEACINAVDAEYTNRTEALNSIVLIDETFDLLKNAFDSASYNQNNEIALQLDIIVNTTVANLIEVAFNAKQERIVNISEDSNAVVLAKRYDVDFDEFINQNDFTIDEIILVKKGRNIRYFV